MKSILLSVLICGCGFIPQLSFAKVGNDGGNGGGGVSRDGRPMTFYSAGLYTELNDLTAAEVPQLEPLIEFLTETKFLSSRTKSVYVEILLPSEGRSYYKVQSSKFTPEVRQRLQNEYARVMKLDVNDIALFAITDISSKTTYLLPEFFGLKPVEQMAILFHEAFWILEPKATYTQVVQAEASFQAFLEAPQSRDRLFRWLKIAAGKGDALNAAIQLDIQSGAINELLIERRYLSLGTLFGGQFFECEKQRLGTACLSSIPTHLFQLKKQYPKSALLAYFYNAFVTSQPLLTPAREGYDVFSWNRETSQFWDGVGLAQIDLRKSLIAEHVGKAELEAKLAKPIFSDHENSFLLLRLN